jgi:nicotinamidase/pyrazinamidase
MVRWDERTALVVVDVQNDFADPDGGLSVAGGDAIIPALNEAIAAARAAGAPVLYTQDWHPPETPHFAKDGGIWPVHCVNDTWGAEFHPDLRVVGEVVRKGTGGEDGYSGFTVRDPAGGNPSDTVLESLLRREGVQTVAVAGLATDYCVRDTALDAAGRGYATFVLIDAVRAVDLHPGDGARALEAMRRAGVRSARAVS